MLATLEAAAVRTSLSSSVSKVTKAEAHSVEVMTAPAGGATRNNDRPRHIKTKEERKKKKREKKETEWERRGGARRR